MISECLAINHPNAVTSAFAYDAAGQVASINHTGPGGSLLALSYGYDANGNRTSTTKNGSAETVRGSAVCVRPRYGPMSVRIAGW